jgi:ABC-type multidrug transport system fused ATPase/permease subunit
MSESKVKKNVANATFSKDAYKNASFVSKNITYSWSDPLINAANHDVELGFKDFPDLNEEHDDLSGKIAEMEKNFRYYEDA